MIDRLTAVGEQWFRLQDTDWTIDCLNPGTEAAPQGIHCFGDPFHSFRQGLCGARAYPGKTGLEMGIYPGCG